VKKVFVLAALALALTMVGCRTFLDLRFQHDRGNGHGIYQNDRGHDPPGRGPGPGRR
jgi:hypothetical protein